MPDLRPFNPWWRDGRVPEALIGRKRRILPELLRHMDLRQMLILSGVRRAGKTTLMFQMISELLVQQQVNPFEIVYYSFDEAVEDVQEILTEYERSVSPRGLATSKRVFLFFDEIQKLPDWPDRIKVIYDLHPNVKVVLSGSASVDIAKGTRESLAGRFFDFSIEPLDLDEYLEFTDTQVDKAREPVFEDVIRRSIRRLIETGGFIEALTFDEMQRRRYFRESILERVIYRDLPGAFAVRSPDLLFRLVSVLASTPGMYLDYKNLGNDLGYDQRTIADYLAYLEHALLIQRLYNYSPNRLTSEKKMKRAYLSNSGFTWALSSSPGLSPRLMGQFFVNALKARFFWRTPQRDEIDLVHERDDEITPVEIKIQRQVTRRDARAVLKFMKKYGVARGYIVSEATETSFSEDAGVVEVIPYWRYWTLRQKLGLGQA